MFAFGREIDTVDEKYFSLGAVQGFFQNNLVKQK